MSRAIFMKAKAIYRFGEFRLDGQERRLKRNDVGIPIAPKAMDALLLLLQEPGKLVERSTIRERLWPGQIVEDGTLSRVIADLRKALGDVGEERHYIETVPKFGYRLTANVEALVEADDVIPRLPNAAGSDRPPSEVFPLANGLSC